MLSKSCFPIISFLHVPGKMSKPLWLMMGTAAHITPPQQADGDVKQKSPASELPGTRMFFLTTKHTFAPWDHAKDSSVLKIPEEFRKQRYVVCRMYRCDCSTQCALKDEYISATLVASHPTLDVSLLSVSSAAKFTAPVSPVPRAEVNASDVMTSPVNLGQVAPSDGCEGSFVGFRGEGVLGQLDTLDHTLLQRLPPEERDKLLNELKDVEGKQVTARCNVTVISSRGAAASEKGGECFHGMSGSPLLVDGLCGGILYGKHPDYPHHIGYTPVDEFYSWVQETIGSRST